MTGAAVLAAAAGALVAVTLLYLLRERRRRVDVAFAPLWARLVTETEAQRLWKRLRRLVSWMVHVAVIALLAAALLDPRPSGSRPPRRVVLVLDASASMRVRDGEGGQRRADDARRAAVRVIESLEAADQALVLRAGATARVAWPWDRDRAALLGAVRAVEPGLERADLDGALALARDALGGAAGGEVLVFTDGGAAAARDLDVKVVAVPERPGPPPEDVAVTGFAIRRSPNNRLSAEAWLEVQSFGAAPARAEVAIETDAGAPLSVIALDLAPGARAERALRDLPASASRLVARLRAGDAHADDDVVYAVAPERRRRRVLLASAGNFFLEGALLLDPALALEVVSPTALRDRRGPRPDVVVLDGAPLEDAPAGVPALALGAGGARTLAAPILTDVARAHPVMRWIALADLNIKRAARLSPEPGDAVLARALRDPLALAGVRGGRRVVLLGFSPGESDLPLRIAFPVLLVNALDWLAGEDDPADRAAVAGRTLTLPAAGRLRVTGPDGHARELAVRGGLASYVPPAPGFYRFDDGEQALDVACNLDPAERDPRPTRVLRLGAREAPAAPTPEPRSERPLRTSFIALALALLAFELLAHHRRVLV